MSRLASDLATAGVDVANGLPAAARPLLRGTGLMGEGAGTGVESSLCELSAMLTDLPEEGLELGWRKEAKITLFYFLFYYFIYMHNIFKHFKMCKKKFGK